MYLKLLFSLALFWSLVSGDNFPVNEDEIIEDLTRASDERYRLPQVIDAIHFDVEITPYFQATATREIWTFDGIVTIAILATQNITEKLFIHENVREILEVSIKKIDNEEELAISFERVVEYQFLQINLRPGVTLKSNEKYIVEVKYIGNINETPLSRGVFRGRYTNKDTGKQHYYLATHLQPTHSRQAFPCLDEPGFKSTFTIIVNRPLDFTDTYSNMPLVNSTRVGNRYREIFYPTPRMSAYLVTIHISEEFKVIADNLNKEKSYRILARPDADGQGKWALDVGVELTKWFEDYLDIPYYTMGENMKNDQIASPDWASGATENWGLVTYRELRLLYEEGETNIIDKMSIGTITAHELAHKWFGNLITAKWWDNVWINEGYASYFEYFAMHGVHPEMELEDQFNLLYLQTALAADAASTTRALRHSVNSPAEVSGHFTGISYSKGASFLMMLNHLLTPRVFQTALRNFLKNRKYEYAEPEHIYEAFVLAVTENNAFDFENANIEDFMRTWVDEPGSPVVKATRRSDGQIDLEQERFYYDGSTNTGNQVWPIPITVATKSHSTFNNKRATQLMSTKTAILNTQISDNDWVILNIQQSGIYRVDYDKKNWELLEETLIRNKEEIHYLNRAQIVDDVFAFMRSGRLSFEDGFKVLQFLKNETNFFVWHPAITGFTFLRNRFVHLPSTLQEFDSMLLHFMDNVINDLGYDEGNRDNLIRIRNRINIMSLACSIGHEGCIKHAVDTFNKFVSDGERVNPNLRRHVYCSGLLASNYDTWKQMYENLVKSNNQADEIVILRALGCTTVGNAVNDYLEMILSEVRVQDQTNAFSHLFSGHRGNAKLALPFIKSRHNDINTAMMGRFSSVLSSLASNLDETGLKDLEDWLEENKNTLPEYTNGINAIRIARDNINWGKDEGEKILNAMRGSASTSLPTAALLITAIITLLFK